MLTLSFSFANPDATGPASWYGEDFAGNLTANGEIFDPSELTAAHLTLPFGTWVRVTNTSNGEAVVVRINDRGPYIHGRIIDLSHAAADAIGMVRTGVAQVSLEILTDDNNLVAATNSEEANQSDSPDNAIASIDYIAALSEPQLNASAEGAKAEDNGVTSSEIVSTAVTEVAEIDYKAIDSDNTKPANTTTLATASSMPYAAHSSQAKYPLAPLEASQTVNRATTPTLAHSETRYAAQSPSQSSARVLRRIDELPPEQRQDVLLSIDALQALPAETLASTHQIQVVTWLGQLEVVCPDYPEGTTLHVSAPDSYEVLQVHVVQANVSANISMLASEYIVATLGEEIMVLN